MKKVSGWNEGVGSLDNAHSRMGGFGFGLAATAPGGFAAGTAALPGTVGIGSGAPAGSGIAGAGLIAGAGGGEADIVGVGLSGLAFICPGACAATGDASTVASTKIDEKRIIVLPVRAPTGPCRGY